MEISPHDLAALRPPVLEAIREVGAFIRSEYSEFDPKDIEVKGRNDLVSYVDRTAEALLMEGLNRLTPGCGFINEESGSQGIDQPAVWIIDPLDGTTNFIHGIPVFSISVALQLEGAVVLGCVYDVPRDEMYEALRGGGARRNEIPLSVSKTPGLPDALIAYGAMHSSFLNLEQFLQLLGAFMRQSRGLRRLGSAALDLAYTAAGIFDGFFESQLNPWDVAAGSLIVAEAGGLVTDYYGGSDFIFGRSIIAGNPGVHAAMRELIGSFVDPECS